MGFTALDGLPMGTRCGQIDPGVLLYLMDHDGMDSAGLTSLLYKECGLLGLSGLSNDMRTLERAGTESADSAIAYFAHHIRRELGALIERYGPDEVMITGMIHDHAARLKSITIAAEVLDGLIAAPAA